MLAVYFACCICNPLTVVAFFLSCFFFLFYFLTDVSVWEGRQEEKVGGVN